MVVGRKSYTAQCGNITLSIDLSSSKLLILQKRNKLFDIRIIKSFAFSVY